MALLLENPLLATVLFSSFFEKRGFHFLPTGFDRSQKRRNIYDPLRVPSLCVHSFCSPTKCLPPHPLPCHCRHFKVHVAINIQSGSCLDSELQLWCLRKSTDINYLKNNVLLFIIKELLQALVELRMGAAFVGYTTASRAHHFIDLEI